MTLFYEFSIDLPNITLLLNFEFYFWTLLPDFSACFQNYVLKSIYDLNNFNDCVLILHEFALILIPTLNKFL